LVLRTGYAHPRSAKADISRVNAELRSLSSAATVEAMAAETAALTRESDALEARLVELRAGGGPPPLSPEALEKVEAEAMACFDAWASRRRIAKDALGALAETFETKEKMLQEEAACARPMAPLKPAPCSRARSRDG